MRLSNLGNLMWVIALAFALSVGAARAEDQKVEAFSGKTVGHEDFNLEPYLGKVPILLDFGSIYCSSCVQSIPHLIVLQNQYKDKLKVVGVNLDTFGIVRVRRFFKTFEKNLNFPILIDRSLQVSKQFDVSTLPTYIFIDKEGNIASKIVGYDEEIAKKIDQVAQSLVEGVEIDKVEPVIAQEVKVLTPGNFTMTYQDNIGVIGLTGGSPGPISVRLNGGSKREAEIKGDMFIARMPLSFGSNFLEVLYPKGDGTGTVAVVLFRDPRMGEGMEANFPEYKFHTLDNEKMCSGCHEMDVDPEAGMMTDFCDECHSYQVDKKWVHGPITVGGCSACHDFESTPIKYSIASQGTDLCFSCHSDIQEKFERGYVHGPVAMGLCIVCHSPHSSNFKFQLRQNQTSMCLGCHDDMRPKMAGFNQHDPVESGDCADCHDPHSSDNPAYFLKGEGPKLCDICHEEAMQNHSHPTEGKPGRELKMITLDKGGNYNCKSCHDPHSSDGEKLFPFEGGCGACH